MLRQHLASQAPAGSSAVEQLDALTALHARIRLGQLTAARPLVAEAPGAWGIIDFQNSPNGRWLVIIWGRVVDEDEDDDNIEGEHRLQLDIIGRGDDGVSRSFLRPRVLPSRRGETAFSPCERWCVAVCETGDNELTAWVFDTSHCSWLPEVVLEGTGLRGGCGLSFLHSAGQLLAVTPGNQDMLLIVEVAQPACRLLRTGSVEALRWLPGSSSVVLMRQWALACLDLQQPSTPAWLPMPDAPVDAVEYTDLSAHISLAPNGQALWAAQSLDDADSTSITRVSVIESASLSCLGSWRLTQGHRGYYGLRVCAQAIALCYVPGCVDVYELTGPHQLGRHLFHSADSLMQQASFFGDGRFLLGVSNIDPMHLSTTVLDVLTGDCVFTLEPSKLLHVLAGDEPPFADSVERVSWCRQDPSQLLVTTSWSDDLMLSVVSF